MAELKGAARLKKAAAIHKNAGELIYKAGDPVTTCYYIRSGRVSGISNLDDGKQYLLRYFEAESFILEGGLISGKLPKWDFVAVEDTDLVPIPAADLDEILTSDPEISKMIMNGLANKYMRCESLVHIIQTHTLLWRLCSLLLSIVNQYGHPAADGSVELDRSINQTTFAGFLGVNRVSVVNTFRVLQKNGLVSCSRNGSWHIRINDVKALAAFQATLEG